MIKKPVFTPEARPHSDQAPDESRTAAGSTSAKVHEVDCQLRVDCMLSFDENRGADKDYVDYCNNV